MLKKLFTTHFRPVHCLNWWNKHCVFSRAEQVPSIWIRVRQRLHKLSRHLKAYLACISTALVLNIPEQCERPRGLPHMNRNIENASKPEPPPLFPVEPFCAAGGGRWRSPPADPMLLLYFYSTASALSSTLYFFCSASAQISAVVFSPNNALLYWCTCPVYYFCCNASTYSKS